MRIILLVLLLIPIFAFHVFICVNTISTIRVPAGKAATGMESMPSSTKRVSRKPNLKVIR